VTKWCLVAGALVVGGLAIARRSHEPAWTRFTEGTVASSTVVCDRNEVRLAADTRGFDDSAVRRIGASAEAPATRVSTTIAWPQVENTCGLTAAVALGDVRVEYVGVPPGRNARRVVTIAGRTVDAEGWPERNRAGRAIDRVAVAIEVGDGVRVWEDGALVVEERTTAPPARASFEISTRCNYPPREVVFSAIR
jgi:hypothetical protein